MLTPIQNPQLFAEYFQYLEGKSVRIFVLGHYLFLEVHSFPRATLLESCSLLVTDNILAYFPLNGGYCLFSRVNCNARTTCTNSNGVKPDLG